MDFRLPILLCFIIIATASAVPYERSADREKRDIMDSMKDAWGEVVKTLSDAGDAVVHVFKPTEKSTIAKIEDAVVNVFKPTEKSVVDKMADSIKGLTQ